MDHSRSKPGAIGRNKANRKEDPQYHRAYKACISCRNKKAKCNITIEEYAAGLPCAKCRREMRTCTFTTERHSARRPRASIDHGSALADSPIEVSPAMDTSTPALHLHAPQDSIADSIARPSDANLNDSMITAVVSNGNDALNLLFEAAQREERDTIGARGPASTDQSSPLLFMSPTSPVTSTRATLLPEIDSELLETWNAYRFVRMGWLSAEETVWLVDMFFKHSSPLSPVLDQFYANHSNHYLLVTQEPMLTCMILTISSRYHTLPTIGGHSRGYALHQRLWEHFQHLLTRLVLGQEKISKAKTRTIGTIEALLLLTEWHPRGLYSPPPSDGWDSDVLFTAKDRRDQGDNLVNNPSRTRWHEDVIEPTHRSDRMCWMVLSCALSLGNELGLFDDVEAEANDAIHISEHELRLRQRKNWLSKLLYVCQEQLASRLGRRSMMPSSITHTAAYSISLSAMESSNGHVWATFVPAWTRLTKIVRSISDLLLPSASATSHIIRSGRYISMIEHIQNLLSAWYKDHRVILTCDSYLANLLMLEYQNSRMNTFSLGLQAIVSRSLVESNATPSQTSGFNLTATDFNHVQEVIDSALITLKIAIKLFEDELLRFCTIRTFLNITTASIFLLKGLGLGVSSAKLQGSLDVLKQVIVALKRSNPDDLHIGGRYATLLEMHMARLEEHFVPSLRPHDITPPELDNMLGGGDLSYMDDMDLSNADLTNNWLSLPLDTSLVPFGLDNFQGLQCLGTDTLDFLWNMGA